ncbi:MAG: hypothetical protein H8E98_00470 [Bacteroidetes bacterium]|nr:hypothetical protein [Bacteroidota bacterium]
MKRVIIATLLGFLFGCICCGFACSAPGESPMPVLFQIIASRTLIGFAIGISSLNLKHWTLHGLIMGLLFSAPLAISVLMAPENPEMSNQMLMISTFVMGAIYGFLIELFTSVVFKAKQK